MNKIINFITNNSDIKYEEFTAAKNQTLFFEGDKCENIGIVKKGRVSIVSYFSDGQEVIYNILEKGGMFGNSLIFSSSPFYRGDVVAIEESEIIYIKKDELLKALASNKELLELYLKEQSDFSKKLNFKIKLLSIQNAEDRIIYYLTFHKREIEYKSILKLSKELYLARETLSRTIYKMERNGIIKIQNKKITLL